MLQRLPALRLLVALILTTSVSIPLPAEPTDWRDAVGYVLFRDGSESSVIAGTLEEWRRARKLRSGREAMLYARRGTAIYTIRDPAILRQADELFGPQRALGGRQSALGTQQEALGTRQEQLGAEQERIGRQLATARGEREAALNRRQAVLEAEQARLGERQGTLGAQQEAMGREQERLARAAEGRLGELVDAAIRRGVARRVR